MDNANRRAYLAKYGAQQQDTRMSPEEAINTIREADGVAAIPSKAFDCVASNNADGFVQELFKAALDNPRVESLRYIALMAASAATGVTSSHVMPRSCDIVWRCRCDRVHKQITRGHAAMLVLLLGARVRSKQPTRLTKVRFHLNDLPVTALIGKQPTTVSLACEPGAAARGAGAGAGARAGAGETQDEVNVALPKAKDRVSLTLTLRDAPGMCDADISFIGASWLQPMRKSLLGLTLTCPRCCSRSTRSQPMGWVSAHQWTWRRLPQPQFGAAIGSHPNAALRGVWGRSSVASPRPPRAQCGAAHNHS